MKYLKVFTDFVKVIEPLGEAEIGRLFMAMLKYAETSEQPDLRGNEKFIWPTAKLNIDREREFAEKQAKNGSLGGRPKTQKNPEKPKLTQKSQKENDKDKEYNNPPISPLEDKPESKAESEPDLNTQRFESFWRMYPKKKDKQNAKKAWDKLKVDGELYNTIMRGLALHRKTEEWLKDKGKYVPYPSTWLNGRRWEDEVETVVTREPERPQPKKLRLRS